MYQFEAFQDKGYTLPFSVFFQKYNLRMRTDKRQIIFIKRLNRYLHSDYVDVQNMALIPFQTKSQQPKNHNFRFFVPNCLWLSALHYKKPYLLNNLGCLIFCTKILIRINDLNKNIAEIIIDRVCKRFELEKEWIKDVPSGKLLLSSDMKLLTRNPLPMQNSKLD